MPDFNPLGISGVLRQSCVEDTFPLHDHAFYEPFIISSGKAVHFVNGKGVPLARVALVLIRPHDAHCYLSYQGSDFSLMNCAFSPRTFECVCAYLGIAPALLTESELPCMISLTELECVRLMRDMNALLTPQAPEERWLSLIHI